MHSVGKRDDSHRPAFEITLPKRSPRNRWAALAGFGFCILPFVIAASEPAGKDGGAATPQIETDGQRSESPGPSPDAGPTVIIGDGTKSEVAPPAKGAAKEGVPAPKSTPAEAEGIHDTAPFVNSLGMEFVPIPGTKVRFCRWDTRLRDWQAYIQAEGDTEQWGLYALDEKAAEWAMREGLSWKNPGFKQTGLHPVVGVNWEDARRFCAWLSRKEGRTYRLPTDSEWTAAVGPQKFPWGDKFPPPKGAGNYCGSEATLKTAAGGAGLATIDGYDDGYPRTSPVGSFAANRFGLYDMGGNVWQWCEDKYKASMNTAEALKKIPALKDEKTSDGTPYRVLRGASWRNSHEIGLRSASRAFFDPRSRYDHNGFRCVLVVPAATPAPKPTPSVELARNAPPASPAPMKPPETPKATPGDEIAINELKAVRKQLKEEQAKIAATLTHLLEWYAKGVPDGEVAGFNQQVRQAWADRDQVNAQLQDVEEDLRKSGGKK